MFLMNVHISIPPIIPATTPFLFPPALLKYTHKKAPTKTPTTIKTPDKPIVSSHNVTNRAFSKRVRTVRIVREERATRVPTKRARVKIIESRGNSSAGWRGGEVEFNVV